MRTESRENYEVFNALDELYLGDNCIQFFIWGGISSDIRSEILFYGDALAEP